MRAPEQVDERFVEALPEQVVQRHVQRGARGGPVGERLAQQAAVAGQLERVAA